MKIRKIILFFILLLIVLQITASESDWTVDIGAEKEQVTTGNWFVNVEREVSYICYGKETNLPYLYNDTTMIYFNETFLNRTIDDRAVSGGMDYTNLALTNQSNTFTQDNTFQNTTTIGNHTIISQGTTMVFYCNSTKACFWEIL